MKKIATILFIIFIGTAAQAQSVTKEVKVETIEMTIATETTPKMEGVQKNEVARLYKFKNTRVKRALFFITKKDRPKMA
ncbi:hypothetical protein [Maribacter sp. 2210JD10-5]|uniref:hypothetical protein n=1 Tax=Maribacter sp. 2210JD10-5 TaxID=3386272 RepID=UPI0039BCAF53